MELGICVWESRGKTIILFPSQIKSRVYWWWILKKSGGTKEGDWECEKMMSVNK